MPTVDRTEYASGRVLVYREARIAHVVLNRPKRHNALTREMCQGLLELCGEFYGDADLRVVVFEGAGERAFCSGVDINEFDELEQYESALALNHTFAETLSAITSLPQVTIAAVSGYCTGGGLAIATHCDLRLSTVASCFGYPIARTLGNALSQNCLQRCVDVFGLSMTSEMLLGACLVDSSRAYAVGALMAAVPNHEFRSRVTSIGTDISALAPMTLAAVKLQLSRITSRRLSKEQQDFDRRLVERVHRSEDFGAGVKAFRSKSVPKFSPTVRNLAAEYEDQVGER